MGTTIFEHTDRDRDGFQITERSVSDDLDGPLILTATADSDGEEVQAYITREAVDRLRAALAPYGTKPEPVDPDDIVKGREYRLLPGASWRYHTGGTWHTSDAVEDGVTRVRVSAGPDSAGDYSVTAVDGARPDKAYCTAPRYLAALPTEAPKPALKAGDKATVTGDSAEWDHEFEPGTVVTLQRPTAATAYFETAGGPGGWVCRAADGEVWDVHTKDLALATTEAPTAPAEAADLLDPTRRAAWEKASEMLRGHHMADAGDVLNLAEFLMGGV